MPAPKTAARPPLRSVPAGAATKPVLNPYGFEELYERDLVTSACCRPVVFARVGGLLDPKLLGSKAATLAIQAAQSIAEDVGKGPTACSLVVQRLARWRDRGTTTEELDGQPVTRQQVTQEELESVVALFDAAMDAGLPDADAVIVEAAAVLKRRAQEKVVETAMSTYAKRGDFADVAKAATAAERIGVAETTPGSLLGIQSFASIESLRLVERLSSGCPELDNVLGGGFPRGLSLFLGRSKAGKSMVLTSCGAHPFKQGAFVAVATLELMEEVQQARVIANLTGVPIDDILAGRVDLAQQRLAAMQHGFGTMAIRYFSPLTTTVHDLHDWLDALEQKQGRKVDVLIVDYITKLGDAGGNGKRGREDSRYAELEKVGDRLRDRAYERRYHVISAAQAKRPQQGKKKKLDSDDVQDSIHLIRSADVVIAMRMSDDEADEAAKDTVDYFITDGRMAKDRIGTGALPVDRTTARMFPTNNEEGW